MKILILTQPLQVNYGGLLQAYALQQVLKRMGHEVWTERRMASVRKSPFDVLKRQNIVRRMVGKRPVYYPTREEWAAIARHMEAFVEQYITVTPPVWSADKRELEGMRFDAYVVGSDQVWRPRYSPFLPNYFLDFVKTEDIKRIAYAASFGTDEWELTSDETVECGKLLQRFDAVSVREDSGVVLCRKYFGVDAVRMPDPTLLLTHEDYEAIVEYEQKQHKPDCLLVYMLDKSQEKLAVVRQVARYLQLPINEVMPRENFSEVGKRQLADCVYPSVGDWLCGFQDAAFVVTDSFHGTVFSLLFNKPFIVMGNVQRGMSRFRFLLGTLGLENRMVSSSADLTEEFLFSSMDYEPINMWLELERQKGLSFLKKNL